MAEALAEVGALEYLGVSAPAVMGVLNVTPDSFSDGGRFFDTGAAVAQARRLCEAGAAIIDVGGESTRPGAAAVDAREEMRRVIPVIRAVARETSVPVSVDTAKPEVMRAAVDAGARLINDVYALRQPGALETAAALGVPVCLMHMQGTPRTMQQRPRYGDVVTEVAEFLRRRMGDCIEAGLGADRLILDPGFGFGKTLAHNLQLLQGLEVIAGLGPPVLVGLSRKSMIGAMLERPPGQRLAGSLALALLAVERGAALVRAHDVAETVDVLKIGRAVAQAGAAAEHGDER